MARKASETSSLRKSVNGIKLNNTTKLPLGQPKNAANERKRKNETDDGEPIPKVTKVKKLNEKPSKTKPKTAPPLSQPAPKKSAAKGGSHNVVMMRAQSRWDHVGDDRLNYYVFGQNTEAQLGLGTDKVSLEIKRPRFNPLLAANTAGIVQLSTGAMHCAALTYDNKILTWGVNDNGALGRDTKWDGKLVDADVEMKDAGDSDSDSDSEPDGSALNPLEATPTPVDSSAFPPGTTFIQVITSDNATFVVANDGFVYGWGNFRGGDGEIGFLPGIGKQTVPMRIPNLANITQLAAGSDHILALDSTGIVYSWGAGEQCQLGRRLLKRTRLHGLEPRKFGLTKIVKVGAGADHSFAIHENGTVYGWGLNNYGQTGIPAGAGEDGAVIVNPTPIQSLVGKGNVTSVDGGAHHSIATTYEGACFAWGRTDNGSTGIDISELPTDLIMNDFQGRQRILKDAIAVPLSNVANAVTASDHCIAITNDGKAYSWGFSGGFTTGLGIEDEVKLPTLIDNSAVRGKKLVWAGAGAQFGMVGEDPSAIIRNGV